MTYQCTFCDIVGDNRDDPKFSLCRKNNHQIIDFLDDADAKAATPTAVNTTQVTSKPEKTQKQITTKNREKIEGNPIKQIENYLNSVIKNDKKLVKKILRCMLSAYTNNPINLGILSPSSEGKTYATVEVSKILPREDVISVGRMSPTALIHQQGSVVDSNYNSIQEKLDQLDNEFAQDNAKKATIIRKKSKLLKGSKNLIDLSGKILLFLDAPNTQLWDALKPILSHDKYEIEYKTTQTDGSLRVKESIIRGWPAVVFCSAKNEAHNRIWEQVETRFDIAGPNSNISKYKEANKFTALKMGIPAFAKDMVVNIEDEKYAKFYVSKLKEKILELCNEGQNPIWNPFNQIMAEFFPNKEGVSMRHCARLMAYCNIEALINHEKNYTIIFKTKKNQIERYVITSLSDIESAIDILGDVSVVPPDKLKFLKDVFEDIVQDDGVTSAALAEKYADVYDKTTTPKKILENYLKPLYDYGILDYKLNPDDKRQRLFRISSKPNVNNLDVIRQRIIEESNNDPLFMWTGIIELEKSSIKRGRIDRILDPEGYAIGHNLIQQNIVKTNSASNITGVVYA